MTQSPPEFSRPVSIARLGADATTYRLTASAEERDALARRFALVSLDGFTATVELSRHGREIRLAAEVIADVVQLCGVTLEPFASRVTDRSSLLYRRQARPAELAVELDAEEEDCEVLDGETIDIGEAVAQQLSLALPAFPRAPGAQIPQDSGGETVVSSELMMDRGTAPRPFAELAKLVKK